MFVRLTLILLVLSLAACGGGGPLAEVEYSKGTIIIQEVENTDRFPSDCEADTKACDIAKDGTRHLIIWMTFKDSQGVGLSLDELDKMTAFTKEAADVHLISGDGTKVKLWGSGLQLGRLFLLFRVPEDQRDFNLYWPDNTTIYLG
jgi:hypothetical protein